MTPRLKLLLPALLMLGGCNVIDRVSDIGAAPALAPIENPMSLQGYEPVRLPMPSPEPGYRQPNSLWQAGARSFLRDQRASRVGDILTVVININDKAEITNETTRTRNNTENTDVTGLLGFTQQLDNWLPNSVGTSGNDLLNTSNQTNNAGTGEIQREEKITLRVAAMITQVLPNGNLVIQGRQQTVVNFEMRELSINGVVRPQDISTDNSVPYDQIAEARIGYGGRGQIMDVQQPRYGTQLMDIILPF